MNPVAVPPRRPAVARSTRGTAFRALLVPCQPPVRDAPGRSFDHLIGRRRWCGVPENASRANLIDAREPTVAGDIGRQYRDEPAFDPALPWYGHGSVLSRLYYTQTANRAHNPAEKPRLTAATRPESRRRHSIQQGFQI